MQNQEQTPTPTQPPILADFLTREQLALELGRSTRTVDRMELDGTGPPFVRLGRRRLFRRESVLRWLTAREQGAPRPRAGRGRR